jgi:hypothetical protein
VSRASEAAAIRQTMTARERALLDHAIGKGCVIDDEVKRALRLTGVWSSNAINAVAYRLGKKGLLVPDEDETGQRLFRVTPLGKRCANAR